MTVVLITGCSSGVGLETALAFAARSYVVYASMRDTAKAEQLLARADETGVDLTVIPLDVTDDVSASAAVAQIEAVHGAIDVLVNNAAVAYAGSTETIDWQDARTIFETNFWGPMRTVRAVLPKMRQRQQGTIVNVGSASTLIPGFCYIGIYNASKHALSGATEALAMEVGAFGIRVASVELGGYKTNIFAHAQRDVPDSDPYAADHIWGVRAATGLGTGVPREAAEAIVGVAENSDSPAHLLVGDDARNLIKLAARSNSFEDWLPVITKIGERIAGPRPVTPKVPGPITP